MIWQIANTLLMAFFKHMASSWRMSYATLSTSTFIMRSAFLLSRTE